MHRLFYKIFLWFWLGVLAVSGTLFAFTELTQSRREDDSRWREKYGPRVDLWARQEVQILGSEGPESLRKYVNSFQIDRGTSNYIFDGLGREVLGRQPSPAVLSALHELASSPVARQLSFDRQRIIADKLFGPGERPYVVVVDFPEPSLLGQSLFDLLFADVSAAAGLRLAAMMLVATGVCVWLTRQIVRPIEQLRAATHAIAGERLDVRVDTALLRRRDELADLGRDFDRMAERIETLVTTHRNFLADASHALRSPLARLNVALGLARRQANPANEAHLDRIEYEIERLNTLIGQLLTMARLDSGVDLERRAELDLSLLVDEVCADAQYEAAARGCRVQVVERSACSVIGAREMLRGAIENVVRNAVRHTAESTAVAVELRCSQTCRGPAAFINVTDHGVGVAESSLGELFTAFRQRDGSRNGVGLGLAITKRAFEIHGGGATAVNVPGGGLMVTLELPATGVQAAPSLLSQTG